MTRVLIVESEIVPRLLYQAKFQSAGFEVIAVGSGKEALAVLQRQRIDIVVMDLFSKTYRSLEIMEAMIAAKPQLPILPDARFTISGSMRMKTLERYTQHWRRI
jgi:CheY-like chemotaxis protein